MKNIFKFLGIAVLACGMMVSCGKDNPEEGTDTTPVNPPTPPTPTNLTIKWGGTLQTIGFDEGIYGGTVHRLTAAKALNGDEYEFPMFVVSMDLDTDPQYGCTLTAHWNYNTQQGSVAGNTLYPTQVYEQYAMQGQYGDYQLVSDADFDPNYQFDGTVHAFSGHIVISFYQYEDFQAYCEAQGIAQPTIADVQASGTMKDLDLTLNNYTFQAASK